ncbi:unnamed protein product, partial [Brassica rapa subsp. trilocularis]
MMTRNHCYCFSSIITIYFSFLIHSTLASPRLHFCRHDQRDALLEFMHEFPVDKSFPSSWNKSSYCCFWEGVECHNKSGQVISLVLSGKYLNGSMKPNSSLFKLQYLRDLILIDCNLQGEIPSSLGNLSRLTHVDLYGNQLVGEIPISIGNLNQLRYLTFGYNGLTGEIPSSLGNLSLTNLTNLSSFIIHSNNFTSTLPSNMSGFHNLETFDIGENSFHGPFPNSLFSIPSLQCVDLGKNHFTGSIQFVKNTSSLSSELRKLPSCLWRLRWLEFMDLSSNYFRGSFPHWICKLKGLRNLDLSNNLFNGSIPPCLRNSIDSLEYLILHNNSFSGIAYHRRCLRSNKFYGPLYQRNVSIGFQSICFIDLSHNDLSGTLPPSYFSNWLGITKIYDFRKKTTRYYYELNVLTIQAQMDIVNKGVEMRYEKIREDFGAINLAGNRLYGKIPESIGLVKELRLLNLSGNAFTSDIPQSLANLTNLETLDLSNNKLSGQIPQDLGK